MIKVTLDDFIKTMNKYFDDVNDGHVVKIKTEKGNIVILSEKEYNKLKN